MVTSRRERQECLKPSLPSPSLETKARSRATWTGPGESQGIYTSSEPIENSAQVLEQLVWMGAQKWKLLDLRGLWKGLQLRSNVSDCGDSGTEADGMRTDAATALSL